MWIPKSKACCQILLQQDTISVAPCEQLQCTAEPLHHPTKETNKNRTVVMFLAQKDLGQIIYKIIAKHRKIYPQTQAESNLCIIFILNVANQLK